MDDRLCVVALYEALLGCTVLTDTTRSVTLEPTPGWQPDIVVTPVNSTTLAITVTCVVSGADLYVQVLPPMVHLTRLQPLVVSGLSCSRWRPIPSANNDAGDADLRCGFVRVWMPGTRPHREAVTQFFLSAWLGS
ncbi:MAG: hypothetical protein R3A10_19265 [Caldilineaceae bacterium]